MEKEHLHTHIFACSYIILNKVHTQVKYLAYIKNFKSDVPLIATCLAYILLENIQVLCKYLQYSRVQGGQYLDLHSRLHKVG